jgi:tetratricopeptide (TPR) repeat protein
MKNSLLLFVFSIPFFACNADTQLGTPYAAYELTAKDMVLNRIESKINEAFVVSLMSKNTGALDDLDGQLAALQKSKSSNLVQYWRAYAKYWLAIYHIQNKQEDASEKAINTAVDILQEIEGKNAEDYALLAYAQGFAIQFKSGMGAGILSAKAKGNAEKAIKADPNNLRGHFVLGSLDFYTPEQYGGGKKVVEYLEKAISLKPQHSPNAYLPSWGKDEAYAMLVEWLLDKGQKEQAKTHYLAAIKLYPNNYQLTQLAKRFI